MKAQIDAKGFSESGAWGSTVHLCEKLKACVHALVTRGWPASFVLMYDEAWELMHVYSSMLERATGGCRMNMDNLAWCIGPLPGKTSEVAHVHWCLCMDERIEATDTALALAAAPHAGA